MSAAQNALRRRHRRHHPRVRRAARAGVAGLDRSEDAGEWFGPRGFTSSVPELDLRVGGALRIVMHGPDGNDYPMKGVFAEVKAPERLVFSNIAIDNDGNHLLEGETWSR